MFRLSPKPFSIKPLRYDFLDSAAGAFATFEGWVRETNDGRAVVRLEYEAYPEMSVREGSRILDETRKGFDIIRCVCVHRTGTLELGDIAVWIGVCAAHRGPAFDACRHIIDEIKLLVPIWKKEYYADGDSGWVGLNGLSSGSC